MSSETTPPAESQPEQSSQAIAQPTREASDVPPYVPPLGTTLAQTRISAAHEVPRAGEIPKAGEQLDDFILMEELGSGSFATVFLALQVSLGRQVALKVARNIDSEARTLAALEHEHIVPVFSEQMDRERRLYLLCMKFVPGTTLERVLKALSKKSPERWSGQAVLDAIDHHTRHEAMFDLASLRDRERLADSTLVEAVCWIGAKVAEALAHAHVRGVLHRDIKPANILLNTYGRPMLSDFNLAQSIQRGLGLNSFGGTLRYMAPEHLEAFHPDSGVSRELVDERSDIYALGVVLYEFLTGKPIFDNPVLERVTPQLIHRLFEERRSGAPSPRQVNPLVSEPVDRVVRRCLDPKPALRYQHASELVLALDGCRHLQKWERAFPPDRRLTRLSQRWPVLFLLLLIFVPHILGSLVNITYNTVVIVEELKPPQKAAFEKVVLLYNALVYPLLLWIGWCVVAPLIRMRQRIAGPERVEASEADEQRRAAVRLPGLLIALSCLGWLPGGIIFPLAISMMSEPVLLKTFGHFLLSFTMSGLIATTYSYFGVQVYVLRVLYPSMWVDPRSPRHQARGELASMSGKLKFFQFAAGLIPLMGAVLVLTVSESNELTLVFRLLVVLLIGLGMAGFGVSLIASSRVTQILSIVLGTERRGSGSGGLSLSGVSQDSLHESSTKRRSLPRSADF